MICTNSDFIEYIDDFGQTFQYILEKVKESTDNSDRIAFLLALLDIEGIGRAAAGRIFSSFASFEDVARYPEEQIASRLKRIPKALELAKRLKDTSTNNDLVAGKLVEIKDLQEKSIFFVSPDHELWPEDLKQLKPSAAPPFLTLYGNRNLLNTPRVCFNTVDEAAITKPLITEIAGMLASNDAAVVLIDSQLPLDKSVLEPAPVVLILNSGLGQLADDVRAKANTVVKLGGLLISPFEFNHSAFAHETDYLRGIANHISSASVFASVPYEDPLFDYMLKLTGEHRPVFAVDVDAELPEGIHPVNSVDDAWWITAALNIHE